MHQQNIHLVSLYCLVQLLLTKISHCCSYNLFPIGGTKHLVSNAFSSWQVNTNRADLSCQTNTSISFVLVVHQVEPCQALPGPEKRPRRPEEGQLPPRSGTGGCRLRSLLSGHTLKVVLINIREESVLWCSFFIKQMRSD